MVPREPGAGGARMRHVHAVIMAGGKGSRLRPFTTVFPKPLMPIGDVPILDLVIRQLRYFGSVKITVATGYLAELIMTYLGDGSQYGVKINFVREKEPLGTLGPLALVADPAAESFLVLNGDVLTTINYRNLVERHRQSGALATVATYRRAVTIDKGVLTIDASNRITNYVEKPTYYNPVAMGIYVFAPEILDYVPAGRRIDVPEVIQRLIAEGKHVQSYPFDGYWLDIGIPGDYQQALEEFEARRSALLHETGEDSPE